MSKVLLAAAALSILALPSSAHAGFTAKQTSRSTGAGQTRTQSATMTFDKDVLRIDQDGDTTVIVEFGTGKFTFLSHPKKQHASITVEEMLAMRDKGIAQMKAQLASLPPEVRKQAEDRIKQLESPAPAASRPNPKATGAKDKVNGYECAVYKWSSPEGENEACLATKVGADIKAFGTATVRLSDRLDKLGGPVPGMAMLQLAKTGFPVRLKRSTTMAGGPTIETVEEFSELTEKKIDPAQFAIPAGYTATDLASLMGGAAAPM